MCIYIHSVYREREKKKMFVCCNQSWLIHSLWILWNHWVQQVKIFIPHLCLSLHTENQRNDPLTDQAPAPSPPINLVLVGTRSWAPPPLVAQRSRLDAETPHHALSCRWSPAWVSPAQREPWMRWSVGHVCEFQTFMISYFIVSTSIIKNPQVSFVADMMNTCPFCVSSVCSSLVHQSHSQWPPLVSTVTSEQEHTPPPHQYRRGRIVSLRAAVQTCTGTPSKSWHTSNKKTVQSQYFCLTATPACAL